MRASSRARSRLPRCAPWRRTTTASSPQATPSSTWMRRSSRAIAACSSEVCGATHASTAGRPGSGARSAGRSRSASGNASVANRSNGTRVVPWNEKTCASGSAATTRLAAPSEPAGAPRPPASCPDSRPPARGRTADRPAGRDRRPLQQPGEVHLVDRVEHAEVLLQRSGASSAQPPSPAAAAACSSPRATAATPACAMRSWRTSSANPRSAEQAPVGRPRRGVLPGEQLAHAARTARRPTAPRAARPRATLQDAVAPARGTSARAGPAATPGALEERGALRRRGRAREPDARARPARARRRPRSAARTVPAGRRSCRCPGRR